MTAGEVLADLLHRLLTRDDAHVVLAAHRGTIVLNLRSEIELSPAELVTVAEVLA